MRLLQVMKQYSVTAIATKGVAIPDPLIMLDEGLNVFTVLTDNVDEMLKLLKDEGVTVKEINVMEQAPSTLHDMLVEGEPEELLGPYAGSIP